MANPELDSIITDSFPDVVVDKLVSRKVGVGERAIPAFVRDWLVWKYGDGRSIDHERIQQFLAEHLPDKQQREVLRNDLINGKELVLLDGFEVSVNLARGDREVKIPSLDVFNGRISSSLLEKNPLLLTGGVWGAGRLQFRRADNGGEVWLTDFQPMQTAEVDLGYFVEQRRRFTTEQWQAMLVQTMGYAPHMYSPSQRTWLIARLALLVEPRLNLIELAPKGTGKSYVFSQLSKNSWLISGGVVTRAKLFYDMHLKAPGVITGYDAVILDEVQTIKLQDEGEILGALKGFLESGEFRVMGFSGNSEASFAMLANIPIGSDGKPLAESGSHGTYLDTLPPWLKGKDASALLDRFNGIIPGWELPRLELQHLATGMGLRADYISEVLHSLRMRNEYLDFVTRVTRGDGDLRDIKSVQRTAAAYVRLLFPHLEVTREEFHHYCLEPARTMRTIIREQMSIMDSEYKPTLAEVECLL